MIQLERKCYYPKTRKGFDNALTFISISGFVVIAFNSFFNLNLNPWSTSILLALAGVGLLEEGNVREIWKWSKDGIQGIEYSYILTILIGFGSLIMAFLTIPLINIVTPTIEVFKGIISVFAIIIILLQRYAID